MIEIEFDDERTVLEALVSVQELNEDVEYPDPTWVDIEVQARSKHSPWVTINDVWRIVSSSRHVKQLLWGRLTDRPW